MSCSKGNCSGPWHYTEAEKLLTAAGGLSPDRPELAVEYVAAAQVHATLALAAATAMSNLETMPYRESEAWQTAAGTGHNHQEATG